MIFIERNDIPRNIVITLVILALLISSVTIGYSLTTSRLAAESCSPVAESLPSWLTNAVNSNKQAYQEASNATGVPWELLAAIHYRETSFGKTNPSNGQGIFQFVNGEGGPYPAGVVSNDEFKRQLRFMASKIQSDYVNRGSLNYNKRPLTQNESEVYRIKDTLFSYNGRSGAYANEATKYGFSPSLTPYEGSPYVMNMFDCKRVRMGLITRDYGPVDGVDTRYGAFTLFARLKGDAYWTNLAAGNLPGCQEATNTTITCIWRLTNTSNGTQMLTQDFLTRNSYVTRGYQYGGVAFFGVSTSAPRTSNIPVYQLTKPSGETFLTTSSNERSVLISTQGFGDNGIAFYADRPGSNSGYSVWRLYSSARNSHVWSANQAEIEAFIASGYKIEGESFTSVSGTRLEDAPPVGQDLVYRFSGMPGNGHFWTKDVYERDSMIKSGYNYEGVAWKTSSSVTSVPVYRLYSIPMKKHLYTSDSNERSVLLRSGAWTDEGIAYYGSATPTSKPIYRLYSPVTKKHLLTADAYERQVLLGNGTFLNDGITYYAY
ncbi:MAG: hypothetical protein EOO17_00365 [Chloroflexi bacterium]|nr:MAG: hypothetical protein EOO17_00365 [Chloroflexota bacterium]